MDAGGSQRDGARGGEDGLNMADVLIDQAPLGIVTTDPNAEVRIDQAPLVVVSRAPADVHLDQCVLVVVTRNYIPGSQAACKISVSV
jgi:hypothetical protein